MPHLTQGPTLALAVLMGRSILLVGRRLEDLARRRGRRLLMAAQLKAVTAGLRVVAAVPVPTPEASLGCTAPVGGPAVTVRVRRSEMGPWTGGVLVIETPRTATSLDARSLIDDEARPPLRNIRVRGLRQCAAKNLLVV